MVGDEAFLPKNRTAQIGLFTLQQLDYGAFKVEAGARYEHTGLSALPGPDQPQFFRGSRDFDVVSGSLGASYAIAPDWRFGVTLSRTARAPAAEELFANGPHAGTAAYELGNPIFKVEKSKGVEAILRGSGTNYSFEASAYHNWFSNFIYEDLTGDSEDGLPVYAFQQADARYYGFEVQGSLTLARFGGKQGRGRCAGRLCPRRDQERSPGPAYPAAARAGRPGAGNAEIRRARRSGTRDHAEPHRRIRNADQGLHLVKPGSEHPPLGQDRPLSFALSANNLFDVNARRHASFLKDCLRFRAATCA